MEIPLETTARLVSGIVEVGDNQIDLADRRRSFLLLLAEPTMRAYLMRAGWDRRLHSVRYSDRDTWSGFFLVRLNGKQDFGLAEVTLTHFVLEWVR